MEGTVPDRWRRATASGKTWNRAAQARAAMMAVVVSEAAAASVAAVEATDAASSRCKISKEGRRNRVRDRVHHRLAATWAAAAAKVAGRGAEEGYL